MSVLFLHFSCVPERERITVKHITLSIYSPELYQFDDRSKDFESLPEFL